MWLPQSVKFAVIKSFLTHYFRSAEDHKQDWRGNSFNSLAIHFVEAFRKESLTGFRCEFSNFLNGQYKIAQEVFDVNSSDAPTPKEIPTAKDLLEKNTDYFENVYSHLKEAAAQMVLRLKPSCTVKEYDFRLTRRCMSEEKKEELFKRLCDELNEKGFIAVFEDSFYLSNGSQEKIPAKILIITLPEKDIL
jgi:hypothetical protein